MTLAGGALREGLIYGMIGKRRSCDVRERTADSLITRYQMDRIQAERVRDAALHAFQQVQKEWQLSEQYGRPMLRWAAMLHELGLCIEYKKHRSMLRISLIILICLGLRQLRNSCYRHWF